MQGQEEPAHAPNRMSTMRRDLLRCSRSLAGLAAAVLGGVRLITKTVSVAGALPTPESAGTRPGHEAPRQPPPRARRRRRRRGSAAPPRARPARRPSRRSPKNYLGQVERQRAGRGHGGRAVARLHGRRNLHLPPQPDPARARRHAHRLERAVGQQAFFFVDGRYIGTDTKEPSATFTWSARATRK